MGDKFGDLADHEDYSLPFFISLSLSDDMNTGAVAKTHETTSQQRIVEPCRNVTTESTRKYISCHDDV